MLTVEKFSNHPIAVALLFAESRNVEAKKNITDFKVIEGEGISANVDGVTVCIGNSRLPQRMGIIDEQIPEDWKNCGGSPAG